MESQGTSFISKKLCFIILLAIFSLYSNIEVCAENNDSENSIYKTDDYELELTGVSINDDNVIDGWAVVGVNLSDTKNEEEIEIEIPNEYEGMKVVLISSGFSGKKVKSIIIPNSAKIIANNAFKDCVNITSIRIPTCAEIGEYAFCGCENLVTIDNFEKTTSLSKGAFMDCTSLKEINIPNYRHSIPEFCFSGCTSLETITNPLTVTEIGRGAFYGCSNLKNFSLSEYVMTIRQSAFFNCTSIETITIPKKVSRIEDYVFNGCDKLTDVIFEGLDTTIGCYTFHPLACLKIDNVTFHVYRDSKTEDNIKFWYKNNAVKIIYIGEEEEGEKKPAKDGENIKHNNNKYIVTSSNPDNLTVEIISYKLSKCVTIPDCIEVDGYTYKVTGIGWSTFREDTKIKKIIIGNNVTVIDSSVFRDCKNLKQIVIKSKILKKVGKNAIKNINKKAVIKVPKSELKRYKKLFNKKTGFKKGMKIKA